MRGRSDADGNRRLVDVISATLNLHTANEATTEGGGSGGVGVRGGGSDGGVGGFGGFVLAADVAMGEPPGGGERPSTAEGGGSGGGGSGGGKAKRSR